MALTEWAQMNPKLSIILISLIVTLFMTVVRYFMTDREKMKEIRERQKSVRLEMKKYKNDPEQMMQLQKKMMEDMPEQMRQSFKPMLITLIPILVLFGWMKSIYVDTAIASSWIWWYIVASIVFGIILGKVFKLQ